MSGPLSATSWEPLNIDITAPGTAEQVGGNFVPDGMEIIVTARISNTQSMFVSNTQAKAQSGAREVFSRGRSAAYHLDNTDQLWVDADNDSDVLEIRIQKIPSSGG